MAFLVLTRVSGRGRTYSAKFLHLQEFTQIESGYVRIRGRKVLNANKKETNSFSSRNKYMYFVMCVCLSCLIKHIGF